MYHFLSQANKDLNWLVYSLCLNKFIIIILGHNFLDALFV